MGMHDEIYCEAELPDNAVAEDVAYTASRKRAFALFTVPLPLGGASLTREDLHENPR
jgi:hypothetical protein